MVKKEKILYTPPRGIGDLIFSLPILHSLHSAFPNSEIEIPIPNRPAQKQALEMIPFVKASDVFLPTPSQDPLAMERYKASLAGDMDKKAEMERQIYNKYFTGRKYNLAILPKRFYIDTLDCPKQFCRKDLRKAGLDYKRAHEIDGFSMFCDVLGIPRVNCFNLDYGNSPDVKTVNGTSLNLTSPYAILNLGTSDERKKWSGEKFRDVADYLAKRGITCVVVGTGSEYSDSLALKENGYLINLVPRDGIMLDIRNYARLASKAKVVVSPDTGLLHLADAIGTSCVGLYGPTNPAKFGPYHNLSSVVSRNDGDKTVLNILSREVIAKLEGIL